MNGQTSTVITLHANNVHWLDSVRSIDSTYLVGHNHVWFEPIQARDTTIYFLPVNVITDTNFTRTRNRIYQANFSDSIQIQNVDTSFYQLPKKLF